MSWGFGGIAANLSPGATSAAIEGKEIYNIETEQLGFQALNGERKLRLYTSIWNPAPSKTASLLAIANQRKLLAAAGPDSLSLYDTDAIRASFAQDAKSTLGEAQARLTITVPRLSQIALTSDENALIIAAEEGGIAIYEVNSASPSWNSAFQIATDGKAIRHLLPNPSPDASHLVALVLEDGKLVMADLKSKTLSGVLKESVSCACWSKKGKQIVVGLADGTGLQLDTSGAAKDSIPKPALESDLPMVAIYWLENLEFLTIHAPIQAADDAMMPDAHYHLVSRDKATKACTFNKLAYDPVMPLIESRFPPQHYISRLRDWQPNLDDTLIIACSASSDVSALTRSRVALSQEHDASELINTYTSTTFTDTRRAALPLSVAAGEETYPIGMLLDLSSAQKVKKPIPNDENIDESDIPLPELCILNQEGVLCAWWYVYNEAVRAKQPAPGPGPASTTQDSMTDVPASQPAPSAFGQPSTPTTTSAFGQTSTPGSTPAFAQASAPAFGQPSKPAFGQTSTPTFGQPSQTPAKPAFGQTTTPAFGKPAFGAPSTPAFGAPSLGNNASPWAAKSQSQGAATPSATFGAPTQIGLTGGSSFGQPSSTAFGKPSVWGSNTSSQPTSTFGQPSTPFGGAKPAESPFSAFAKPSASNTGASPFAGFAQNKTGASPFASFNSQANSQPKASPFATQSKPGLPNETSFGSTVTLSTNGSSFGSGSTFAQGKFGQPSEPPKNADKPSGGLAGLGGFKLGSTFKGDGTAKDDLPKPANPGTGLFGSAFGSSLGDVASKPKDPLIKEEPKEISLQDIPAAQPTPVPEDAPLPPDFTSAKGQPNIEDVPLPPDFMSARTIPTPENAPLPPDFITTKSKPVEDAPLPPDSSTRSGPESTSPVDAPLPPDFLKSKPEAMTTADAPLPPDFLPSKFKAGPGPVSPSSPPAVNGPGEESEEELDDEEEEGNPDDWEGVSEEEDEEDLDDDDAEGEWEEEDEDVEEDDEDEDHTPHIVDPVRLSAFTSRITPASPKENPTNEQSTTPETLQKPTFTPAGFPKAQVTFPPPQPIQESPRSPSPVRTERAVTSPVRLTHSQPKPFGQQSTAQAAPQLKASTGRASIFPTQKSAAAPVEELVDDEDTHIKNILAAPIEPSLQLPDFTPHVDYNGQSEKSGIAGQLERVYRDVNSMIDSLGLNARALASFIAGHSETIEVKLDSIEDAESLTIGNIYGLEKLQANIGDQLESGKLADLPEKYSDITEQLDHLMRLDSKATDIRKLIALRTDPTKRAQQQQAALPPETAAQQVELRQSVQHVQKLLAQVEESMIVLRADLASMSAASAEGSGSVPTVEAVIKTISKMTAMIEKKSGDVDLLEAQIRKLPGGLSALGMTDSYENGLIDSLAGSRLSNGHSTTSRSRNGGINGMFGSRLAASTTSLGQSTAFDPAGSLLGRSTTSLKETPRKKMSHVSDEEVKFWNQRAQQRRDVLYALKSAVEKAGEPKIIRPADGVV